MFEGFQITALAVIPVLGFLIFVHELGHFLAARWMGVTVLEFGFGYPPRAARLFERNGVEYTLNWLPFGGFVRMAGEDGNFDAEGSMAMVAPWRRIVVLAAGPIANVLTAVVIFAMLQMAGTPQFTGDRSTLPIEIIAVAAASPAEAAGILPGDIIDSINGAKILGIDAVTEAIRSSAGNELAMVVLRDGEPVTLAFTPRLPDQIPAGQGASGIQITEHLTDSELVLLRSNPVEAVQGGVTQTGGLVVMMVEGLGTLGRSLISPSEPTPEGGVGGLVAIGRITAEVAQQGWRQLAQLTAFLSINLAILNLLPIPALDGGRIVFALVEMLRRKRIPPEKEAIVHFAGYALLLALMVFITFVDVSNWIAGKPALPGG
ncbi:MAG: site-2 protease family protein [Caldilineales bacterium]|nr:site-2 protease family protein [Caldilineales bacterium]